MKHNTAPGIHPEYHGISNQQSFKKQEIHIT